jgi:uncharacterized Ntn-hydrolase superfamily protein
MTFSIVATDGVDVGVAVASKFVAVGAFVPHGEAGVGAVATQCCANPRLGKAVLALIRQRLTAREAVEKALAQDPGKEQRQIGAVGIRGNAYGFTGGECPEHAGHVIGSGFVVSGNILAGPLEAMARAFETQRGSWWISYLRRLRRGRRREATEEASSLRRCSC